MLAYKGELEPSLSITNKVLVNGLRQVEGGMPDEIDRKWEQYAMYTDIPKGPMQYFRRVMKDIGW
eukprot:7772695-Heterocapsa_arctica.AAC.1